VSTVLIYKTKGTIILQMGNIPSTNYLDYSANEMEYGNSLNFSNNLVIALAFYLRYSNKIIGSSHCLQPLKRLFTP